jgi:hypothetical protein
MDLYSVYLGSIFSKEGGKDEDINAKIKKARFAFSELKSIWKSKASFPET